MSSNPKTIFCIISSRTQTSRSPVQEYYTVLFRLRHRIGIYNLQTRLFIRLYMLLFRLRHRVGIYNLQTTLFIREMANFIKKYLCQKFDADTKDTGLLRQKEFVQWLANLCVNIQILGTTGKLKVG